MENYSSENYYMNNNETMISEIHKRVRSTDNMKESLPELIEELKNYFECEALTIFAVDQTNRQLFSINEISDEVEEIRVAISLTNLAGYVAGTGTSLNIANVKDSTELSQYHPQLAHDSQWDDMSGFTTKSMLVVPIPFNRSLIGIFEIINSNKEEAFSTQDLKIAQDIAPALGMVLVRYYNDGLQKNSNEQDILPENNDDHTPENNEDHVPENNEIWEQEEIKENDHIHKNESRDKEKQEEIFKISQAIYDDNNYSHLLAEFKESILEIFDAEDMTLYELDESKNEIYSTYQTQENSEEIRHPLNHTNILGHVAISQQSVNIENIENINELKALHSDLEVIYSDEGSSTIRPEKLLALPLVHEEVVVGVLKIVNKRDAHSFSENDEIRAAIMAGSLAQAIANQIKPQSPKATKFDYLIENNFITDKVLESSLSHAESNQIDQETVLIERVGLKRENIGLALENFYNIPYFGYDKKIILPQKILGGLNKNFLAKNFWIPIHSDNLKVVILINDPSNPDKIQNIKHIFPKKNLEFNVGLKADILDFLNSILEQDGNYLETPKSENMSSLINSLQDENDDAKLLSQTEDELDDTGEIKEGDNAIIRLVNKILIDAYDRGASDIHIEPGMGKDNVVTRFRKDGECSIYEEIPYLYKNAIISRIKIMSQLDIAERRIPQDGKFKMRYGNDDIEFRVATCPTVGGNEDIVLRILAKNEQLPLENMNFSESSLRLVNKSLAKPYGLILVVGPTGSGKTTTLHSCLGSINNPKRKIWTVEDPVEITQKGIRQVQTLEKKGLNFARAMRSFLRGDPDVIMVGEMRDKETASIGLEASLTGHLVLSTLHTNSAPETVTRLLDMGMNPLNFADSLLLVVAQRLVKTLCKNCSEEYHPSQEEFDIIVNEYGVDYFPALGITYNDDLTLKKPVGCEHCDDSGYAGRTAIHELLEGTEFIKRMIVKQASAEELRKKALETGMNTLKQDGIQKIFHGDCDLKQVLAVCII